MTSGPKNWHTGERGRYNLARENSVRETEAHTVEEESLLLPMEGNLEDTAKSQGLPMSMGPKGALHPQVLLGASGTHNQKSNHLDEWPGGLRSLRSQRVGHN